MKSASADRLTGWRMGESPFPDTATANTAISPATESLITTGVEPWTFSTVVFCKKTGNKVHRFRIDVKGQTQYTVFLTIIVLK